MAPPGGGPFGHSSDDETATAAGASGVLGVFGVFGVRRGDRFAFGYVPAGPHGQADPERPAPAAEERGFRIHPVGRPDDGRSASRGLRFAVAAAGAVSLAAVALGSMTTAIPGDTTADARGGSGTGSNAIPARSAGTGAGTAATPDSQRRRALGPLLVQGGTQFGQTPAVPTSMSAPLVPGLPSPGTNQNQAQRNAMRGLTAPVMAGAAAVSPLIRPLDDTVVYPLNAWSTVPGVTSTVPGVTGSGLLTAHVPGPTTPTPSPSASAPHQTP
ncbi:hypothetical protein M878_14865 [Streptomyces roseochromogenus subsp. oscitans DS 12.976]|uniref:Uncharacterized protein n=2 Tax=Streptomyces roseochromogenus TaxID=285450 RepID=V6KJM2_STRRC|nr:hypothetical protein M878_14865 [Streptomyces roseochromogenus subsp. oscitans DS 12.976]